MQRSERASRVWQISSPSVAKIYTGRRAWWCLAGIMYIGYYLPPELLGGEIIDRRYGVLFEHD